MTEFVLDYRLPIGITYITAMAAAIALDLWLVLVRKAKSISLRTWLATKAHPTLIAAGILASVGVCYLVQAEWPLVMFTGIMSGHLFVHY